RRKVGTALLNRALRVCRQFEADSLKCMVVGEEGSGMDGLLKSWGMECGEEDHGLLGRISLADIVKKAVFPDLENDHIFALRDVRKAVLNNCDSHLCGLHGWDVPDQELSCLYVKEDKALASFLVRRLGDDLVVEWMAILPGENALLLLKTISYSLETAIKKYPPDTEVVYSVWSEAAEKLIAYIFKDDKREELPASCYRLEGTDYSLKFCPYEAWETTEGE
nr:hypothetical protein [Lachnospiraceae bacterium]